MKILAIPADLFGGKLYLKEPIQGEKHLFVKYKSTYNDIPWTKVNGKPVKNWKQTLRQVWFKPEHKEVKKVISSPVRPATYKKEHEFEI